METYDAIMSRRSIPKLDGRTPTKDEVERLLQAAVMAPNHHLTEPWRFVVVAGTASDELGEVLAASAQDAGANVEAARRLPTLAPVIIVVIDRAGNDHHVPESDEHYAVGAAMQNLLLAACDAGLGTMIRTGIHARAHVVREHLGVKPDETIAGFIYLGHVPSDTLRTAPRRTPVVELTEWRGLDRT